MLTGKTIDELISTVERVERQARSGMREPARAMSPRRETFPAFSTYMYDLTLMDRAVVGVA